MIDPEFELKKWALERMRADTGLTALVPPAQILAFLPEGATLPPSPYIVLGAWTANGEDFECIDGLLISMVINCYTTASGATGGATGEHASGALAAKVAARVRKALKTDEAELTALSSCAISHRVTRNFPANGGICMASVNMEATFDQPDE